MTLSSEKKILYFRPNSVHVSFFIFYKRFFPAAGKDFYSSHGAPIFFFFKLVRVITLQESGELRWVNRESEPDLGKVNGISPYKSKNHFRLLPVGGWGEDTDEISQNR